MANDSGSKILKNTHFKNTKKYSCPKVYSLLSHIIKFECN